MLIPALSLLSSISPSSGLRAGRGGPVSADLLVAGFGRGFIAEGSACRDGGRVANVEGFAGSDVGEVGEEASLKLE